MLRKYSTFLFLLFITATIGCSLFKTDYSELVDMLKKIIHINEVFALTMETSNDGKKAADAVEAYSRDMIDITPNFREVMKKFKKINLKNPDKTPPELKKIVEFNLRVQARANNAMNLIMSRYGKDPETKRSMAALARLNEALSKK